MYKNATDNRYQLEWEGSVYTLSLIWSGKFIDLANEMIGKGGRRPASGKSGYDRYDSYGKSSSGSSSKSGGSSGQRASSTPPKWKDHPKRVMYQNLKDTVKLREEQLKRASGSDKDALQNELNAAKRMLDNLNKKYNFESNIQNFSQFNQIFEKSKFVETDEFNELLDKINDTGITSLTDIEKKRLELFSMDDEPILDVIERMGDLTAQFKIINKKLKDLQSQGKIVDAKNLFRDEWGPLNDEMTKLEQIIQEYGIDLGDETFMSMMNKHRADVYGYDPDNEGNDELEMDM
jgi:vacuolar-type H+-ATPase subunit I/STV1